MTRSTSGDSYSGRVAISPAGPSLAILSAPDDETPARESLAATSGTSAGSNTTRTYQPLLALWQVSEAASRPLEDVPLWRTYLQQRLDDFSGADSPGSPSRDALAATWHIVSRLLAHESPTPSVVPGDEGSVELVWQRGGWHIELEIGPREAYVWAKERDSGETWSGDLEEVRDLVRDLIASLARPRDER